MSWARRAVYAVAAPLVVGLLKGLWATCRFSIEGEDRVGELAEPGRPCIITLWHESVLVCAWYLSRLARRGVGVTYLVSPSVDGEFGARLLGRIDANVVRGSATRSGVKAMHGLFRAMRRDSASPVVLPDGPQGPRHHCKPGSLVLARVSGVPVLPIGCAARICWRLPTWDRQIVPLPFARIVIVLGEPYTIVEGADEEEMERERVSLEHKLQDLQREAESRLSRR